MKRAKTVVAVGIVIVMMLAELGRAACVAVIAKVKEQHDLEVSNDLVILEAEMIVEDESRRRSQDEHPSQEYPDHHG